MNALLNGRAVRGTIQGDAEARKLVAHLIELHKQRRFPVGSGSTPDMLKEIPGDRIRCVQLNDGPLRLPAGVTLEENCFDRGWPGTGEFPLIEIVRTLADMDALRQVSPEVFSSSTCTPTDR